MYKYFIRRILFMFSPETAHKITFFILKILSKIPGIAFLLKSLFKIKRNEKTVFGITFPNPVGLAAGLDKDAEVFDMLGYFGFGFVEIGTVTPKAQIGNSKPRLFRLKKDKALINRMGFNNKGVDYTVEQLRKRKSNIIIGGNIGKNKITPNNDAVSDYKKCFIKLYPLVDYFVVNISSPNTPGLRELQEREPLKNLLEELVALNKKEKKEKPILLKIAPDLNNAQIDDVLQIINETGTNGIVATNTTIERTNLSYSKDYVSDIGAGGLSGKPIKKRSLDIVRYINKKTNGKLPIIGVGGIMSAKDAIDMIEAGADLVQIYTGFIYEGTALIKKINRLVNYEL